MYNQVKAVRYVESGLYGCLNYRLRALRDNTVDRYVKDRSGKVLGKCELSHIYPSRVKPHLGNPFLFCLANPVSGKEFSIRLTST